MKTPQELDQLLKDMFTIFDAIESNDDGTNEFHPTYITSCRVMDSMRLGTILADLREHIGLNREPREPNADRCDCCNGDGEHYFDGASGSDQIVSCTECNGTGRV